MCLLPFVVVASFLLSSVLFEFYLAFRKVRYAWIGR